MRVPRGASLTARPDPLRHLIAELDDLAARELRRERVAPAAGRLVLCSNDYLGYASTGRLGAVPEGIASGCGASRLVAGEHDAHLGLEGALCRWLGTDAALVFTSGYAANVGLLSALAGPGDLVVSDALNHASIVDGCRLSRATVVVVPHLRPEAVRDAFRASTARRRFVVTESYFSMDGDCADLGALREVCDAYDAALLVDEAHALGVFGPAGRGRCAELGVRPDALVGTFGKALGAGGAFVAGSAPLVDWLWNRARSFVFSTGLSPAVASLAARGVQLAEGDEAGRASLEQVAGALREILREVGAPLARSTGPILPVVLGDAGGALRAARALADLGVHVQAIRAPTVPAGSARLRVTASAVLGADGLERARRAFVSAFRASP